MAIGAIFEGTFSQAQYEQVRNQVLPDNQLAPGLLSHVAGPAETGWVVVEVWESREAIQRFFDERLGQALQQANINVQPRFFQVATTIQP
jgi:quinol monooxygenase YgiN